MDGGRKNEISGSELLDAAQALEFGGIDELDLERANLNVAVRRIAD
jgi:hypothetical protein